MAPNGRHTRPARQRKKRRIDVGSSVPGASGPMISSDESSSNEKESSSRQVQDSKAMNGPSRPRASESLSSTAEQSSEPSSEVSTDSSSEEASSESEGRAAEEGEAPLPAPTTTQPAQPKRATSPRKAALQTQPKTAAEQRELDFESWYLKAMTAQFGDDLDKVRQAPDFKASSVSMLVKALKQGVGVFSEKEREVILNGGR